MSQAAPNRTYLERPAPAAVCGARYEGCTGDPTSTWLCETEGAEIRMCSTCFDSWRRQAADLGLVQRCPRCRSLGSPDRAGSGASGSSAAAPAVAELVGAAATAINHAMHMEGVLPDVRKRVLRRLAQEAGWLEECDPAVLRLLWLEQTAEPRSA